ncbi:TBC1 domain family member 15-like [Topomyia yanbarensis]|uniref:TBC1 domain family member 15-like n=1 Tax=Topomyia yanbarensis TaxID=2498891 RepID=UPI00273AF58F|nr:TBC1 domain family member 15-like [Topomyia yanbarensis]
METERVEEIFMQHGVMLKKASATYLSALNTEGVLTFGRFSKGDLHFFEWKQAETCEVLDTECQDSGWSLVDTIESTSSIPIPAANDDSNNPTDTNWIPEHHSQKPKISIQVLFRDVKGIEYSRNELRFFNQDLSIHSLYLFHHGSPFSFVDFLERKQFIRKSARRKQFFHCLPEADNDKLQRSFSELNIEAIRNRPRPNPYYDFMSKLANVHNQILPLGRQPESELRIRLSPQNETEAVGERNGGETINGIEENTVSRKLVPRPPAQRGSPLDAAKWLEYRAPNGSIMDPDRVKDIIFRGGINEDIRAEVWKYLLGLDIWEHSTAQRDERRGAKTQEYFQMKLQWLTITSVQEHNFTGYRERKCQIEKDVKRTDRTYDFFAGDDNPNLAKLSDILMTYVMYNFDLGYVQGMSDLLAPILSLVQNEAESFWCFVGFMQKVFSNFDIDQKGMKQQLEHLRTLLAFVNEDLYNYLKENQSENMYFCFRWLLVWFKREFSNKDIMQLWEVLWSGLPCPNFHLFVCVAILDQEMDVFINGQFTFTEILKHVNELSGNLNLLAVLEQAESIYLQVKKTLDTSKEPHVELKKLIGEEVSPDGAGSAASDEDDDSCMSIVNEKSPEDQEMLQRKVDEACDLSMSYAFF